MIAATVDLDEAHQRQWDVIVVGAGPAGSMAARGLARHGLSVLLVDQASFPRWKVCGSCLNGHALSLLHSAGLGALPARLGAIPLRRFEIRTAGLTAQLPLPAGVAVSRSALDAALVESAIGSGVQFLPRVRAALSGMTDSHRRLRLRGPDGEADVSARVIVSAAGLGSSLGHARSPQCDRLARHPRVGAGVVMTDTPLRIRPGTIYMACAGAGYVGLVRLEDGRLDVAAAFHSEALKRSGGPGPAARCVLKEAGLPALPELESADWRGTPPLTRTPRRLAGYRLLKIGDAAGYVEPFTGEGISWAFASAAAVIPVALRGVRSWHGSLADEWQSIHGRVIRPRQRLCRALTAVLRRPALTRVMVRLLCGVPSLAGPIVRHLNAGFASCPEKDP